MEYKFVCKNCGEKYIIPMRISEYESKGHICRICNGKVRDVNDFATAFDTSKITGFAESVVNKWKIIYI